MGAVRTWVAAGLVVSSPAAPQEFVLEPANHRAVLVAAARARFAGEVAVPAEVFATRVEDTWRVALDASPTPAERLALATAALAGDWSWVVTVRGAALARSGAAEARLLEGILARETVTFGDRWGESRVESLVRLARESELPLVLGVDVSGAVPDGGRRAPPRDPPRDGPATVAGALDRLLGTSLARVARAGRVHVVSVPRARWLADAEAEEVALRARLEDRIPLELGPAATLGDLLEVLAAALGVPVVAAPGTELGTESGAEPALDRVRPLGATVAGRVPARVGLRLLERATGRRACVVGNAVWLASGERARVLRHGPWGDVLLEDELRRWPLALPPAARRLVDAPDLLASEGLALALDDAFRTALSRFDMQLAPPRVDTTSVADVLDRMSSACGSRGWHVQRGEIRLGPQPRAPAASGRR